MTGVTKAKGQYVCWCHGFIYNTSRRCKLFLFNQDNLKKFKSVVKGKRINRNYFDQILQLNDYIGDYNFWKKIK